MNIENGLDNYFDVDYMGIVGIRFENISGNEKNTLAKHYSNFVKNLDRDPDIIIRFVDKLKSSSLIFLGLDFAAFDRSKFYVINDPVDKKKVVIPFDKIGQKLEIICEKGVKSIPLLNHIVNFYLIKKGFVPIHSSGFYFDDKGILVMGWTKGGKTETLLSFANHGAEYVGDEWVVISKDGSEMFGLHVPITIWKWQLPYIKKLINKISLADKAVFLLINILELLNRVGKKLKLDNVIPFTFFSRGLPQARKLLKIRKLPRQLFTNKIRQGKTKLDIIVLAVSHENTEITANKCESEEIINRMIHSNDYEQLPFNEYYKAFKYAFPDKKNEFLDNIKNIHSDLLSKALEGKKSIKVSHPYPVSFEALYAKLNSAFSN
ncbi:MAG TPA: hypothetical protein VKA26_04705 [Ignavibacteriaceae bacterium]|nr:hypothetical protein [Ignavibacteriaceae bacterium]